MTASAQREPSISPRFQPDLIVETTMLCDRSCSGCYAPTILARRGSALPSDFLSLASLEGALATLAPNLADFAPVIAVRGGEPTLHPALLDLLSRLRQLTTNLYLETNGHWILKEDEALLQICKQVGVIVKISFDSMHTLKPHELHRACDKLDRNHVEWTVAITEATELAWHGTVTANQWLPLERAVFQPKAVDYTGLVKASIAVIRPDGAITSSVSMKTRFGRTQK